MADGRQILLIIVLFSDLNQLSNVTSNEYRNNLINNAESTMENNRKLMCEKNCCGKCVEGYDVGTTCYPNKLSKFVMLKNVN